MRGKKMQIIEHMLRRKQGVTSAELKQELGWPSVSIPQRARQLGIVVRKETRYVRVETRYFAVNKVLTSKKTCE